MYEIVGVGRAWEKPRGFLLDENNEYKQGMRLDVYTAKCQGW